jgi:hypothetical protein
LIVPTRKKKTGRRPAETAWYSLEEVKGQRLSTERLFIAVERERERKLSTSSLDNVPPDK